MRLLFDLWVSWWIGLAWLLSGWLIAGTLSLAGIELLTWLAYALALIASVGWPVVIVVVLSRRRGWGWAWWF